MTQIRSGNPFLRAAETGVVKRTETKAEVRATSVLRAVVNHFPTDSELGEMINHALTALKRGIYWDRGSIVNLQV
jgi:hypothetical protein